MIKDINLVENLIIKDIKISNNLIKKEYNQKKDTVILDNPIDRINNIVY